MVDGQRRAPESFYRFTKRLIDLVGSLGSLVLFAPVMLCIFICILAKDGRPVIHRDERLGLNGARFKVFKFRTLDYGSGGQRSVAPEDDDRITASGLWLRRWRLDELPQLVNVFLGDMSLVGPRPISRVHAESLMESDLRELLSMRPGITDPATVQFLAEDAVLAGQSDPENVYLTRILPAKVNIQLEYVREHSVLGDLGIIVDTLKVLWSKTSRRESEERIRALLH